MVYIRRGKIRQDSAIIDFSFDIEEDSRRYPGYLQTAKEILYWEVDPRMYMLRKLEIGGVIVSQNVPEPLIDHLHRLQRCYLFGLDEVAVVFCRSLLESGFFTQLSRRGKLRMAAGQVVDMDEFKESWQYNRLVGMAFETQLINKDEREKALQVGRAAGQVLHGKQTVPKISREDACKIITTTFSIVESLFA